MSLAIFRRRLQQYLSELGVTSDSHHLKKRFNQSDLLRFMSIPCPIIAIDNDRIVEIKNFRRSIGITESSVCVKCPKAHECPFANKEVETQQNFAVSKFQDYLKSLNQLSDQEFKSFVDLRSQDNVNLSNAQKSNFVYWGSSIRIIDTLEALKSDTLQNEDFIAVNLENYKFEEQEGPKETLKPDKTPIELTQKTLKVKKVNSEVVSKPKKSQESDDIQSEFSKLEKKRDFKKNFIQTPNFDEDERPSQEQRSRNDFSDKRQRRYSEEEFGNQKENKYGNRNADFERQPRRDFNNDRQPRRDFNNDRQPRRDFEYDRQPRRDFERDERKYRRDYDNNTSSNRREYNQDRNNGDRRSKTEYESERKPRRDFDNDRRQRKDFDNSNSDLNEVRQNKRNFSEDNRARKNYENDFMKQNNQRRIKQEDSDDEESFEVFEKQLNKKQQNENVIKSDDMLLREVDEQRQGGRKISKSSRMKFTKTL